MPGSAVKALVTSANRKLPLLRAIQDQLDSLDPVPAAVVVAGDADPRALAAVAWPQFWAMPRIDEAPAAVLDGIATAGFDIVIPTRDADVAFLARHRDDLAARSVQCMVSPAAAVARCDDKISFAEALVGSGLPAIGTYASVDDPALSGSRLVVKERHGAGARRMALDVTRQEAALAAAALAEPVFQPFVPGREVSIDAYRTRDGRTLGLVARSRDLVVGGEAVVSTTIDPTDYARLVTDVLDCLGIQGHALVQVIDGPDGPRVVECNARLGGASTLSLAAGLLSVAWFALEAQGIDPAALPFEPHDGPLRLIRTAQDVIDDPRL